MLGSNGAGKTTLFNAVTGDFPPTSGRIRFFGEDVTTFPVHERIRRGLRRTYQISPAVRRADVRSTASSSPAAAFRAAVFRFCARAPTTRRWCRRDVDRCSRSSRRASANAWWRRSVTVSSANSKSRWRSPARRASSCSTSPRPDLSPPERRDLVAILNALPNHIGFIIIEHDLDVALRVSAYVSMMHNGRLLKEGTPEDIEADKEVQEIYLGGRRG